MEGPSISSLDGTVEEDRERQKGVGPVGSKVYDK